MMKTLATVLVALSLTGCASIAGIIPSFWDDNQSAMIVSVRLSVENIDCERLQHSQALHISQQLRWFQLYSESKGSRQQDVLRIIDPIAKTTEDWVKRAETNQPSTAYCETKKKIMQTQTKRAAEAVLGRF